VERPCSEGWDEDDLVGLGGMEGPGAGKDSVRKSTWLPLGFPEEPSRVTLSSALRLRNSESRDAKVEDEGKANIFKNEFLFASGGADVLGGIAESTGKLT